MIKPSLKTILMTFFLCSQFIINAAFASEHASSSTEELQSSKGKKTVPFNFKIGAGVLNKENPNGTEACEFTFDGIPCVTSMNLKEWLLLGDNLDRSVSHFIGAFPSIDLNPTANIFWEYLQFALLSSVTKEGHLSQEETIFSKALSLLNRMMSGDKTYKEVAESHVGCHLFMPKEKVSGAVLLLSGSKGARQSEFKRAEEYAKQGVLCLIPDPVSTDRTNHALGGNSTIGNQLAVSFFGRALNINIALQFLQGMKGVNPKKIVIDGESIGTTQTLLAFSQEVIAQFEEDFTPPVLLALNDFSPTLITSDLENSLFWKIPKVIWGGTTDEFTPLSQVRKFLERCPEEHRKKTTLRTHDGYHDARALDSDTKEQAGGTYKLADATNYTGLCVSMRPSIEEIRETIGALSIDASEEDLGGALGGVFVKLRLYLENEDIELTPIQVPERINKLPKGGTFGPSSTEEADKLRADVIETVLRFAKPSLDEDEEL